MEEEKFIIQSEEKNYNAVDIQEDSQDINKDETIEYIDVESPEIITVTSQEAFPALGESNHQLNHALLTNRELPDQHPISSITGLTSILKTLSSLKNIYTKSGGLAEFRKWADNNTEGRNRTGYFVSIVNNDGEIAICDGNHDVYGVIVSQSGVCGYQDSEYDSIDTTTPNKADNWRYAKVCLVGDVRVRVNPNDKISVGDYVLPNIHGCASVSENGIGFRVSSTGNEYLKEKDGSETMANFVTISLVPQNDNISRVMGKLKDAQNSISNVIIDIGDLKNGFASISDSNIKLGEDFDGLQDLIGELENNVHTIGNALTNVEKVAQEAKSNTDSALEKVNLAYTNAVSEATSAREDANSALADVESLRDNLQPLVEWKNGDYEGIAGFVTKSNEESTQLGTLVTRIDENGTSIGVINTVLDKNVAQIRHLVAHADRYSVGALSMSNGLSYDAAREILHEGHIYVSTSEHTESSYIYKCILNNAISERTECYFKINDIMYTFKNSIDLNIGDILEYDSASEKITIGDESFDVKVAQNIDESVSLLNFVSEYVFGFESGAVYRWTSKKDANSKDIYGWYIADDITLYTNTESIPFGTDTKPLKEGDLWYCWQDVSDPDNDTTYLSETLYRWDNEQWVSVATINGNIQSRSIGLIVQTDKKLSSSYTNLRGDVSNISQTVDKISTVVLNVDGQGSTLQQAADEIIMGTFDPTSSTSLALLLNGFSSTSGYEQHIHTNSFSGTIEAVGNKYSVAPTWDETNGVFVFDENYIDADGIYYFYSEDRTRYCKVVDDGYQIYTIGNIALASINARTSENESSIEALTTFNSDTNKAVAMFLQKANADGSESTLATQGKFIVCLEIKSSLTDDEKNSISAATKYSTKPEYDTTTNCFEFSGDSSDDGIYYILDDNTVYYKAVKQNGEIIGYEKYGISSCGSAYLAQKVDSNSSSIGMVVDSNGVKGAVLVDAINGQSSALISADKILMYAAGESGATSDIDLKSYIQVESGKISQVVSAVGENGEVTAASIVASINESASTVFISADKIGINGTAVFTDNLRDGSTTISGDYIRTGTIQSNNYVEPIDVGAFAQNGMEINLDNGTIFSKNFLLDTNGDVTIRGDVIANSGYIGGFTIANDKLYSNQYALVPTEDLGELFHARGTSGVFISPIGIGLGNGNFYVDNEGNLTTFGNVVMNGVDSNNNSYPLLRIQDGSISLSGSIDWSLTPDPPVFALYASFDGAEAEENFPTKPYKSYPDTSTTQWHKKCQYSDIYVVYSYQGGQAGTWEEVLKIADIPDYIHKNYIDSTSILSPNIYGGMFYATGKGADNGAAYYIYNGVSIDDSGNPELGDLMGYISYDTTGTGLTNEQQNRVIFATTNNSALKISAATNMSISAGPWVEDTNTGDGMGYTRYAGTIFFMSNVSFCPGSTIDFKGATIKGLSGVTAVFG